VVFLGFPLKFGINIRGKVAILQGGTHHKAWVEKNSDFKRSVYLPAI
jgi:hypothetical protein